MKQEGHHSDESASAHPGQEKEDPNPGPLFLKPENGQEAVEEQGSPVENGVDWFFDSLIQFTVEERGSQRTGEDPKPDQVVTPGEPDLSVPSQCETKKSDPDKSSAPECSSPTKSPRKESTSEAVRPSKPDISVPRTSRQPEEQLKRTDEALTPPAKRLRIVSAVLDWARGLEDSNQK